MEINEKHLENISSDAFIILGNGGYNYEKMVFNQI